MDPSKKEITNTNQYMYNQKDEKCQERSEFYKIQKAKKQQKSK